MSYPVVSALVLLDVAHIAIFVILVYRSTGQPQRPIYKPLTKYLGIIPRGRRLFVVPVPDFVKFLFQFSLRILLAKATLSYPILVFWLQSLGENHCVGLQPHILVSNAAAVL